MKQLSALVGALIIFSFGQNAFGLDFPPPLEKCKINDETCMIDRAHKLVKTFPHGLDLIDWPDMEPLLMNTVELVGDSNSPASINISMKNLKFHNFSDITVKKIRGYSRDTTKPMKISISTFSPKMALRAKYKVSGRILILPITGDGELEWIVHNTESKIKQVLEATERDGKTYLKLKDFKISTKSTKITTNLTNLFNGDKALSEGMLSLINDNWEVLAAEIQPLVDREITAVYRKFLEKLYDSLPYDEFFLPDEK